MMNRFITYIICFLFFSTSNLTLGQLTEKQDVNNTENYVQTKNLISNEKTEQDDEIRIFTRPPLRNPEDRSLSAVKRNLISIDPSPKTWFNTLSTYYHGLELRFRILWIIITVFLLTNIYLLIRIGVRRYYINQESDYRKKVVGQFKKNLAYLIFRKKDSDENENKLYESTKKKFKKTLSKRLNRNIVLELLITAQRILRGESSNRVVELFNEFGYKERAFSKIESPFWQIKIKGVRELSLMNIQNSHSKIIPLFDDKKTEVRMESKLGIIRLLEYDGLKHLNDIKNPISKWVQTEMLDSIKHFKSENIPDSSYCLDSKNNSVVLLTIRILNYLNQLIAKNKLINILKTKSLKNGIQADIRIEIIHTLRKWRILDVKDYLKELFVKEENIYVKQEILKYFMKLGTKDDLDFLIKVIDDTDYLSNVYTLKTIFKLVGNDKVVCNAIVKNSPKEKIDMTAYFLKIEYQLAA